MNITIDRFEGKYAVVELSDGRTVNVPKELFADAAEGDRFSIIKDEVGTAEQRERIQGKFDRLKRKN